MIPSFTDTKIFGQERCLSLANVLRWHDRLRYRQTALPIWRRWNAGIQSSECLAVREVGGNSKPREESGYLGDYTMKLCHRRCPEPDPIEMLCLLHRRKPDYATPLATSRDHSMDCALFSFNDIAHSALIVSTASHTAECLDRPARL